MELLKWAGAILLSFVIVLFIKIAINASESKACSDTCKKSELQRVEQVTDVCLCVGSGTEVRVHVPTNGDVITYTIIKK